MTTEEMIKRTNEWVETHYPATMYSAHEISIAKHAYQTGLITPTKYKVGDEVWFILAGNAIRSKVRRIERGLYFCDFYATTASFREEELYQTEEQLLKELN